MKSILAWVLSLILVAFTVDAFAGEKAYFAGDNEPLYGTWINMNYSGMPPPVIVFNPDGTGGSMGQADSNKFISRFKSLITRKWTDDEGNIMYKEHFVGSWKKEGLKAEGFTLFKVSNSGDTLEYVFESDKYPEKIDPSHSHYRKYTRKK